MKSKLIFIILIIALSVKLFGQDEKDTIVDSKRIAKKIGFSYSLLTSRQINPRTSNSINFIKLHPIRYTNPSSQFSFFYIMDKNKFFIKHELSYSKIHTRIYSDWMNYSSQLGPYVSTNIEDYNYQLLNYNAGFGLKLKKINFIGGFNIGYLLSNNLSSETSNGTNTRSLQSKKLIYGLNFEVDYSFSKKWYLGIGTSLLSKISDGDNSRYQYYTQSLKLSLGFYIN